ncbi:MAG TPA: arsenate reductase ArsC [Sedimentisphaerales bacterium]|nr:arsenate reductase ArsC [Sedimentisphaerales bacterium]
MDNQKKKLNVLFLCTGNSCRSQMAEGWARHLKGDVIEAFSAGVYPVGVSLRAAQVMAEAGVDISGQRSKHVDSLAGVEFDYVVTLCDSAAQMCPVFAGITRVLHRPFADPGYTAGSNEAIMAAFRDTRDKIRAFIATLPESLEERR